MTVTARERRALLAYAKARRSGKFPQGLGWALVHGLTDYPNHPCATPDEIPYAERVAVCAHTAESMAFEEPLRKKMKQ